MKSELRRQRAERFAATDLYLVIGHEFTRGRSVLDVLSAAAEGGVRTVQLREKNLSGKELTRLAEQFRKKDPVLIILVLASVLLAAASLYSLWERTIRLSVSLDSSVAIIGGADGPTSIFLAGRIAPPVPLYVITIGVIGAAVIYYIVRRRRK